MKGFEADEKYIKQLKKEHNISALDIISKIEVKSSLSDKLMVIAQDLAKVAPQYLEMCQGHESKEDDVGVVVIAKADGSDYEILHEEIKRVDYEQNRVLFPPSSYFRITKEHNKENSQAYGISINGMISVLIKGVQELSEKIDKN